MYFRFRLYGMDIDTIEIFRNSQPEGTDPGRCSF